MKRLAEFIMRGRMQAIVAGIALSVLSVMITPAGIFCSAAIALVTLRQGAKEGFIVLSVATLATFALTSQAYSLRILTIAFALLVWLPVWLASIILREGRHFSLTVESVIWLSLFGVGICYLFNSDMAALWREMIPLMLTPEMAKTKAGEMLSAMAPTLTGVFAASASMIVLLGLFMGRWWQSLLYNPGGFRHEFLGFQSQPRMAFIFLALLVLSSLGLGKVSEIALNATAPVALLYSLAGIAVAHTFLSTTALAHLAIPMFYISLLLMQQLILPVALVGLLDTWLNIRKLNLNKT